MSALYQCGFIAAGLSPFAPDLEAFKAGRLMLSEIASCIAKGESFGFETTLSGLSYRRQIEAWRAKGFHVTLFFLSLPTPELAIVRVAYRVKQGGHHIPESIIRRRFWAGLSNFECHYRHVMDAWALYDNSGDSPVLIEWGEQ